jgi:hypothetical protein
MRGDIGRGGRGSIVLVVTVLILIIGIGVMSFGIKLCVVMNVKCLLRT